MIRRVFVGSGPFGDKWGGESTEMMDIEGMAVSSVLRWMVAVGAGWYHKLCIHHGLYTFICLHNDTA